MTEENKELMPRVMVSVLDENDTETDTYYKSVGDISDGYHTFDELYEHRNVLFATLCLILGEETRHHCWRSKFHHDGTMYDGYFIAGIETPMGQATYHVPLKFWDLFQGVSKVEKAPEYDGHTPADTLERLKSL